LSELDGRYYLLDFGRVFPPQMKMINDKLRNLSNLSLLFNPDALGLSKRRHLYELLRPELVASYAFPLSPDALTGWGVNDPNNGKHNDEVRDASNWLLTDVIPQFAAKLSKLSEGQLAKVRISDELHRKGINIRHLGRVRSSLPQTSQLARQKLLNECLARCMKSKLNERLRDINKELRVPLEEPYRKEVLNYLNKALRPSKKWWKGIKLHMMEKFVDSLTEEEINDPNLIR